MEKNKKQQQKEAPRKPTKPEMFFLYMNFIFGWVTEGVYRTAEESSMNTLLLLSGW